MKLIRITILAVLLVLAGCTTRQPKISQPEKAVIQDSVSGQLVADTIIYDVIIHNLDPDDQWAQQRLQYLNQSTLIDSIFELVYNKKIIAYDFFEKKPLTIKEIKKMESEEGFSRNKIGKIQFAERWYFDSANQRFRKEVISLVLGYDRISSDGILLHKPVFKIYLNP